MNNKRIMYYGMVLAGLLALVGTDVVAAKNGNGNGNGNGGHKEGHAFMCETVSDISKLKVDSRKPTVVVFYSETCPECDKMVEPFNAYIKKHKNDINCAVINIGAQGVGVRNFAETALKVTQIPSTVVIHKRIGSMTESDLENYLNQMTGMTAFANKSGTKMVEVEPTPAEKEGKITGEQPIEVARMEEEEFLNPTDKPLNVLPEDLEDMYDEEFDEEPYGFEEIARKNPRAQARMQAKASGTIIS